MLIKVSTAIFLLSLVISCAQTKPSSEGNITMPKISNEIELVLRTDKAEYQPKEQIKMRLTVTNKGRGPFKYTFPSAQIYDFVVKKEGKEVWRWSADKMFAMMLTDFTLNPKQSVIYNETWDQRGIDGNFVFPGQYELLGIIKTHPESLSFPLAIEIMR